MTGGHDTGSASLACVILAHDDPTHVRRLIDALDPFPVFLHCDRRTPGDVFTAMVDGLPTRCTVLERMATGWARWGNVEAELAGYRAALDRSDTTHIALLTGSDYPLASTARIADFLSAWRHRSIAYFTALPRPEWGRGGGMARLRYRHLAYRKRMLRLPVPRRLPGDVVLAGGSQVKVLAREHARAVVECAAARADLVRFWRWSWAPDETFVASVLNTPSLVPRWRGRHLPADLWWIGWDGQRRKSPPWLTMQDFDTLAAAGADHGDGTVPKLFARKFCSSVDTAVLDAIDLSLRVPVDTGT